MKLISGIVGIVFAVMSLSYVAVFGTMIGRGASSLGIQGWGESVQVLSWVAPLLAVSGVVAVFSRPWLGAILFGLSAYVHWYLLGFGMIGNIFIVSSLLSALFAMLAALQDNPVPAQGRSSRPRDAGAGLGAALAEAQVPQAFNRLKWEALVEYDAQLRAVADRLRPHGQKWVDELGAAFLAMNDKAYLPEIERRLLEKIDIERQAAEEQEARDKEQLAELNRQNALLAAVRAERIRRWRHFVLGTRLRQGVLAGTLLAVVAASAFFAFRPAHIDSAVVWMPPESLDLYGQNCGSIECLARVMNAAGATSDAIAFSKKLFASGGRDYLGYADSFTHYGPVDLVHVQFPWLGMGGIDGFFFVNPDARIVDGHDFRAIEAIRLYGNAIYAAIRQRHPQATVWDAVTFERQELLANGYQRFIVSYHLLDGCHACAVLGSVYYSYDFDPAGKFMGVRLVDVSATQPQVVQQRR